MLCTSLRFWGWRRTWVSSASSAVLVLVVCDTGDRWARPKTPAQIFQTRLPYMWSIGTPNVRKPQTEGGNFRRFFCKFFLDRVAVFRVDLKTPGDRQFPRRRWQAPHRWVTGASTTTLNEIPERIFDDPSRALHNAGTTDAPARRCHADGPTASQCLPYPAAPRPQVV